MSKIESGPILKNEGVKPALFKANFKLDDDDYIEGNYSKFVVFAAKDYDDAWFWLEKTKMEVVSLEMLFEFIDIPLVLFPDGKRVDQLYQEIVLLKEILKTVSNLDPSSSDEAALLMIKDKHEKTINYENWFLDNFGKYPDLNSGER